MLEGERICARFISMPTITKEQVEHIAKLARISLSEEQKETMTKELGAILTYVEKLKEVDTTGVEPTAQVTGLQNVFRKDEVGEQLANPADLIAAAPDRQGEFVKVKEVFQK